MVRIRILKLFKLGAVRRFAGNFDQRKGLRQICRFLWQILVKAKEPRMTNGVTRSILSWGGGGGEGDKFTYLFLYTLKTMDFERNR
jgi:hypothetical protein